MDINLNINGKSIDFKVELGVFNKFQNESLPTNKVGPSHNFLTRCVLPESKEDLSELLKKPGAALTISTALVEVYVPDFEITVGKSKQQPDQ